LRSTFSWLSPRRTAEATHHKPMADPHSTKIALSHFLFLPAQPLSDHYWALSCPLLLFGRQHRTEMSLESHSEEARSSLAAFLISILKGPQHWYSPMLSEDNPSRLTDEIYYRATKAQFSNVDSLGFDRGKMNRAISTCACIPHSTTSLNQTILVPSGPRNGPRSIRGNEKKQTTGLVKTISI
jgi:hypothetical protein